MLIILRKGAKDTRTGLVARKIQERKAKANLYLVSAWFFNQGWPFVCTYLAFVCAYFLGIRMVCKGDSFHMKFLHLKEYETIILSLI